MCSTEFGKIAVSTLYYTKYIAMNKSHTNNLNPTISAILPVYNGKDFVIKSVQSLLNQTFPLKEIIIIDDGSTDKTPDILAQLQASNSTLHVITQRNQGVAVARNTGLNMVTSEYVQFLDADDILHPTKLEHQARLIAHCSYRPDFVAAAYEKELGDKKVKEKSGVMKPYPDDDWIAFMSMGIGLPSSNLWKVSSVRSVGSFDSNYYVEDADLVFRLLSEGAQVLRDYEPLTVVVKRADSRSNANRLRLQHSMLRVYRKLKNFLQRKNAFTGNRKEIFQKDTFIRIRELYRYSPSYAIKIHNEFIDNSFNPYRVGIEPRMYGLVYSVFGFQIAQKISPVWYRAKHTLSNIGIT